ncbi:SOL4 (YGR248W) and SOL3 (YHR163W) [Zygosaccharomyces parabailii]|nr:SOL4 (YGR248W) and SOL3 (YHR163W) [Zygosaccharomyces parabailii]CDH15914.1 related to 6-phosphogluconolactonase 3 [Zygosaccharomyces bailii ISA1307]
MVKVYSYKRPEFVRRVGQHILQAQDVALERDPQGSFTVGISGGSLIKTLYEALVADKELAPRVKWPQWHIYFVDERIVPLDDPDSNYGAFKKGVLDPLSHNGDHLNLGPTVYAINESLVHGGPEEKEKLVQEYSDLLPGKPFDLLLLGCGPDGHTCSLFPDAPHEYLLGLKEPVAYVHDSPKPPSDRITFTLPVIQRARDVAFVAEGSAKQDVMHEIFDKKDLSLPTARINSIAGDYVSWFVDPAAFEKVTSVVPQ